MTAPDLAAFLIARIAEDERIAEVTRSGGYLPTRWELGPQTPNGWCELTAVEPFPGEPVEDAERGLLGFVDDGRWQAQHIARHDPTRVLADCAAKRAIVELYAEHADYDTPDEAYEYAVGRIVGLGEAVRLLATVYADHPDYRPEFAPRGEDG